MFHYWAYIPCVFLCDPNDFLVVGFSNKRTYAPGGARGVLVKSNCPFNCAYTLILGFTQDVYRRLSVNTACGINMFHKTIGNLGLVEHKPAIKWCLNICIALSVVLVG